MKNEIKSERNKMKKETKKLEKKKELFGNNSKSICWDYMTLKNNFICQLLETFILKMSNN